MTPDLITSLLVAAQPYFDGGATFDLVDLATVQAEFQTETDDVSWLQGAIKNASEQARTYCNRTFQVQSFRDDIYAYRSDGIWRERDGILQLANYPLANIPSPAETAPPVPPVLSAVPGGALAAAVYFARITYVTPFGETAASLETRLPVLGDMLLSVAAPVLDRMSIATGWNVYLGSVSTGETKQNASPLPLTQGFILPGTGLIDGDGLPNYLSVVEHRGQLLYPLIEGQEFVSDALAERSEGKLTRLRRSTRAEPWRGLTYSVEYDAGFVAPPGDIQDQIVQLVKLKYFARDVDPGIRESNVEGVYEQNRWFGTGPGGTPDMPNYVSAVLDRYRVPVVG